MNSLYLTLIAIVKLLSQHAGCSGSISRIKCCLTELRNIYTSLNIGIRKDVGLAVFILPPLWLEPRIVHSVASRRTNCSIASAAQTNTHILFATVKTVTKTTAVRYILYFYTPCRHKGEWSQCSTHSQCLHQMVVNGQCTLGKADTVPSEQESGWATVAVRVFCAITKCVVVTRIEPQTFLHVE